jgi:hypothetical protein
MEYLRNLGVSRAQLSDLARELQDELRSLNKLTSVRLYVNPIPRQGFEVVTLCESQRKSTVLPAEDVLYHDERLRPRFRPGVAEDVARRVAII